MQSIVRLGLSLACTLSILPAGGDATSAIQLDDANRRLVAHIYEDDLRELQGLLHNYDSFETRWPSVDDEQVVARQAASSGVSPVASTKSDSAQVVASRVAPVGAVRPERAVSGADEFGPQLVGICFLALLYAFLALTLTWYFFGRSPSKIMAPDEDSLSTSTSSTRRYKQSRKRAKPDKDVDPWERADPWSSSSSGDDLELGKAHVVGQFPEPDPEPRLPAQAIPPEELPESGPTVTLWFDDKPFPLRYKPLGINFRKGKGARVTVESFAFNSYGKTLGLTKGMCLTKVEDQLVESIEFQHLDRRLRDSTEQLPLWPLRIDFRLPDSGQMKTWYFVERPLGVRLNDTDRKSVV